MNTRADYSLTDIVSTDNYPLADNFARRLRSLMKSKGMKQIPLANAIGVSQSAVSAWLNGAMPEAEKLLALSDALETSIDYLIKGEAKRWPPATEAASVFAKRFSESPEQRKILMDAFSAIAADELILWKNRAEDAECRLALIQDRLRQALEIIQSSAKLEWKVDKASFYKVSPEDKRAIELAESAVDHELRESQARPRADAPSGGNEPPSHGSSHASKVKHPSPPKRAQE